MKTDKIFRILLEFIPTVLSMVSCQQEEVPAVAVKSLITVDGRHVSITAGFEECLDQETKTSLVASKIWWGSTDHVVYAFDSEGGTNVCTSTDSVPSLTRTFAGEMTAGSEVEYVLWAGVGERDTSIVRKTDKNREFENRDFGAGQDGSVVEWDRTKGIPTKREKFSGSTLKVMNPQNIDQENSFASAANIAIMKKGDTAFRNVFGYLRFTVPQGVDGHSAIKSVTFEANENMAGDIQIEYSEDEPVVSIIGNKSRTLTVNMRWTGNGYEAGTVYAVLPPGTYTCLKIRITPVDGEVLELSQDSLVIRRSRYTDCGTLPASEILGNPVQVVPAGTSVSSLCVDNEYHVLYAGLPGQLNVYDISSPLAPVLQGSVPVLGNIRQMTSYEGKLYITARETGTWIFDVSSPLSPVFLRRYDSVELATGLDVAGYCMFIGQRQNGIEFVDITTPSAPKHIRLVDEGTEESQSVFYQDGYLYSGEWTRKISIFDAHDLSQITHVNTINLQGQGDGLWVMGNRLYAATGLASGTGTGHGVEIYDITDPVNPDFISRTEFASSGKSGADWWLVRPSGDGKTLFCGDVYHGLYILDIEDEAHPEIIEHLAVADDSSVNSIALATGVLYLATAKEGLLAMSSSRALPSPRNRGTLPQNEGARYDYTTASNSHFVAWKPAGRGAVHSVAAWGDALFVGCGDAGLSVVKVHRNGGTVTATTHSTLNIPYAGGVAVRGNRLYVSRGEEGVGVYKITAGPVLTHVTTIKDEISPTPRKRYSCWVSVPNDNYVVNGSRYSGFEFLAVGGTGDNPTFTYRGEKSKNVNYNKYISEEVCANDRLPYATRDGLFWADLSSTSAAPVSNIISSIKSSIPCGVTNFKGGSALITDKNGNLFWVESGANSVSQTATTSADVVGIPRWDGNDSVMLTDLLRRSISKVDLSNFTSPSIVYKENTSGNPEPGIFVDGKAVVPCGYQGLLIEK